MIGLLLQVVSQDYVAIYPCRDQTSSRIRFLDAWFIVLQVIPVIRQFDPIRQLSISLFF